MSESRSAQGVALIIFLVVAWWTRYSNLIFGSAAVDASAEVSKLIEKTSDRESANATTFQSSTIGLNSAFYAKNSTKSRVILPNLLIAGTQKAGSTTLSDWLFDNGACGGAVFPGEPPYFKKEVHFFDSRPRFGKGLNFYARRYQHCQFYSGQIAPVRLDATPGTVLEPDRVFSFYKSAGADYFQDLKVVVSIREPISRELSLYNHQSFLYETDPDRNEWYASVSRSNGTIKTFDEFIESVTIPNLGRNHSSSLAYYATHLRRWFELFGPEKILVLSYEEDIKESYEAQRRIKEFLAWPLPSEGPFAIINANNRKSKVRSITCSTRDRLSKIFAPWNEELYQLLATRKRPTMERQPFPRFSLPDCQPNKGPVAG